MSSNAIWALAMGGLVMSAAPQAASADGFAVRARPDGLERLSQIAPMALPPQVALPNFEKQLFNCPGDLDIVAETRDGVADIDWHSLDLSVRDGVVEVDAVIDLVATTELKVKRAYACIGVLTCDVGASATPLAISFELAAGTSADGRIELYGLSVDLGLTADDFDLDISGCAVGEALEWVVDSTEDWILESAVMLVEDLASDKLSVALGNAIDELVPLELSLSGFEIAAALSKLDIDSDTGLTLIGDADITWMGQPDSGEPATEPPTALPLPEDFGPGDFSIAASDDLVTRALYHAWKGGLLEAALAGLAPTIELDGVGLAQKLGFPAGTTIGVSLAVGASPEVAFGREADGGGIRVKLTEVTAKLKIESPGAPTSTVEILLDATLVADAAVDGGLGALNLVPKDLSVDRLEIRAGSSELIADPARLGEFLRTVGTPMLGKVLQGMPISPAISPVEGLYIYVAAFETEGGYLRVGADIYAADPSDTTAPDTQFRDAPTVIPAGIAAIPVSGTDNSTPTQLLRYTATLDGQPITPEPSFLQSVYVSAPDGEYTLEVSAIDLIGNVDASPAQHKLIVDGVPPVLEMIERPPSVIAGDTVVAKWSATDNRDKVATKWELRKLSGSDSYGKVVDGNQLNEFTTDVELSNLDSGSLYVMRVTARDEAGNVTSSEFGFSFDQGGCSVGGGASSAWLVLLALGLLFVSRRRGAVLAAIVALAIPAAASAQGVGTNLSGPTDADGASSFWNPAAMLRGEGTRFDMGSGVSLIRIEYQPEDTQDTSRTFVPKPEPTMGMYSDALGPKWRVGFTLGVPSIDGASWARDDDAAYVTRYYAVKARTFHVAMTPSMAYQATPWLSVGGGLTILHSRLDADIDKDMGKQLNQTLGSPSPDSPFPYAHPDLAAPVDLNAAGWGVGLVAGVLVEPHETVSIGASIHTPATSHGTGTVEAEYADSMMDFINDAAPGAMLPELNGEIDVDLKMPLMAFSAVSYRPLPDWELRADHRYVDRSSVSNTDLIVVQATSPDISDTSIVRGYQDRHSVGLRLAKTLRGGAAVAALRGRFENNSVPENTASPSNIDFSKLEVGAVVRWAVTKKVSVTGQYSRYILKTRTVDESLTRPLAEPSLDAFNKPSPTGTYTGVSDYVALAMSVFM